jgi:hypothetical protein
MSPRRLTKPLAIGAAIVVIGGSASGIVAATSGNGSPGAASGQTARPGFPARAGSNARSGPAAGGVVGTVSSVPTSSFTVSTPAGQKVTVKKMSSTTYRKGTSSTSAGAIKKGDRVLVLGTTNGTTITASQVVVQPPSGGSPAYSPSKVAPFKRGGTEHVEAGRPGPGNLQSGLGDDRQRNDGEQGHHGGTGRLSGRRRRPRRQAEQRRVRGPQHRRQLASPHLRQQELQGRRRQLGGAGRLEPSPARRNGRKPRFGSGATARLR